MTAECRRLELPREQKRFACLRREARKDLSQTIMNN